MILLESRRTELGLDWEVDDLRIVSGFGGNFLWQLDCCAHELGGFLFVSLPVVGKLLNESLALVRLELDEFFKLGPQLVLELVLCG